MLSELGKAENNDSIVTAVVEGRKNPDSPGDKAPAWEALTGHYLGTTVV